MSDETFYRDVANAQRERAEAAEARLATLEAERDAIVASLDELCGEADSDKSLPQRVRDELSDYMDVLEQVSRCYGEITMGRFSKPNTDHRYIVERVREIQQEDADDAVKEATEELQQTITELQQERDAYAGKLHRLQARFTALTPEKEHTK